MRSAVGIIVAVVVLLFGMNLVLFTVTEIQQVVVLQFGESKRVITEPGLYFKLPDPIQNIAVYDKRLLDYDSNPDPIYTKDKKILRVDNYARWRIIDALLFREAVGTVSQALERLDDIVYSELRKEIGQHELHDVIAANREVIMLTVTERCDAAARAYGIEVADVRIKRADLPEENEGPVFERMRAERNREAKAYRSQGEEQALIIRAETDLEAATIRAAAYEKSQVLRGEGDAEALRIYASAYKGATEFYEFTRTLEAYETALNEKTVIVQPMNTDFFRFLKGN